MTAMNLCQQCRLPLLAASLVVPAWLLSAASSTNAPKAAATSPKKAYPTIGAIERLSPKLDALVAPGAQMEKLADGFQWTEGPVWMGSYLLFSDIPANTVFKWMEGKEAEVFLKPSGYTGSEPRGGESGSNGLTRDRKGRLILCQHGDRCVARLDRPGHFTVLARHYKWYRFNSPNDVVVKSNGDLYFTDPPYGLEGQDKDPRKEMPFQGVFRVAQDGKVTLLTDSLSRPNGLAFSPDESILYVANSDPTNAVWTAYPVKPDGTLGRGRLFFDATELAKSRAGGCDGLKVDQQGNLFATGPGGVLVFSPEGEHLGTLLTGVPTANCAWGNDGSVLYITANKSLCRIKTLTRGKL